MNIIQSPSPNFYTGRKGYNPEMIVVHCTDGYWPSDMEWLRSTVAQASAHFVISPGGEIHQLVALENGAWHAGRVDHPVVPLKTNTSGVIINPNYYSIGIEVSLKPPALMTEVQKDALLELIKSMATQYGIPVDRKHIVGHREIYSLKTCPGTISVDDLVTKIVTTSSTSPSTNNNAAIKAQIVDLLNKIV